MDLKPALAEIHRIPQIIEHTGSSMHKKIVSWLLASSFAVFLMLFGEIAIGEPFSGIGPLITEPVAKFAETKAQSLLPANFSDAKEVRLSAVTATEIEDLKKFNANSGGPLAVGFPRAFPEVFLSDNSLTWITLQDGSKVTQVKITSPGANALRLQLNIVKMDDRVELTFIGNGMSSEMVDPVTTQNIPDLATYWSPTTSGDTTTLEIHLPSKSTNSFVATISLLSHFATNPSSPDRAKVTSTSLSCEVDVACRNSETANAVANAVAWMIFQKDGRSRICTGTLLNNTNGDRAPYFLTAAHCISDQTTANTLQTYWFYRTTTCGVTVSPLVKRSSGAQLLYTNAASDVTLMRLYDTPPPGVSFLGWRTMPVGLGSTAIGIHHPNGDQAKISVGVVANTNFSFSATGLGSFNNFLQVGWNVGLVEGGSSGSALLAADSPVVTGTLTGGPSTPSCSQAPWGAYSPFSSVYPSLARWLQPATTQITPQSGWWWNPSESGRGFSIEVSGNHLFMAGYLYASDTGQAIWFSSGGNMSSSSAYQGTMTAYGNGQTLTGSYVSPIPTVNIGTISLNFTDATHGTLTWPGGTIPIERFNIVANGVNAPRASFQPETGWWYSPSESGRGFALEIQNGVMFLAGYMYEGGGRPIWFSSANQMSSPSLYQGNWVLYANGQTLYGAYRPPVVASSNVGSLQIQFQSTTSGALTLPDGRVIPISRFRF